MRRRALLAGGAASLAALAGCTTSRSVGTSTDDGAATETTPANGSGGMTTQTSAVDGDYPVPASELRRGAAKDAIPAIVDPVFDEDWSGLQLNVRSSYGGTTTIEPRLGEDDQVIGLAVDGEARAYPLRLLTWHEVANDTFGQPLLVTYCPLCRTGVTAIRTVKGEETTFGVSGKLWKSNLVMYDELTESLWSQVAATAIRGPEAGTRLTLVPSTITSWGEWQDAHPETSVLLPPPESNTVAGREAVRNYNIDPYVAYANDSQVGLGRSDYDDRLHPKTVVVGVSSGDVARAYPLPVVEEAGLVNDRVGDLPVVVTTDASGELVAYDRRVGGETLTFEGGSSPGTMTGGGSTWRISTGTARDGPHEGAQLARANARSPMFWFSWADIHPESEIYGSGTPTG